MVSEVKDDPGSRSRITMILRPRASIRDPRERAGGREGGRGQEANAYIPSRCDEFIRGEIPASDTCGTRVGAPVQP